MRWSSSPAAGGAPSMMSEMSSWIVRSSSWKGSGLPCFIPRSVDDLPAIPVPTRTILTCGAAGESSEGCVQLWLFARLGGEIGEEATVCVCTCGV